MRAPPAGSGRLDFPAMKRTVEELKAEILRLTREYSASVHGANRPADDARPPKFVAGETTVPYAGRVFTEDEVAAAVSSTLDFWLTLGPEGEALEAELAMMLGVRRSILCNSGSSANLLALSALTSQKLEADRRLLPGDEVITCAAGFPTTVSPIVQCGAVPVFLDNDPLTGNADLSLLEAAFVPGKTKAVMIAHALGNPFDLSAATEFCRRHEIWLIEDNCDALGSTYTLPPGHALNKTDAPLTKWTGTFGTLSTQSFYPPHHLTLGEGGAVNIAGSMIFKTIVESLRDWGRDCWCASGKDNTCNKRFGWQLGELPEGYDHKYIYSHFGYNLKPLDIQAAIGRRQLQRLPAFVAARKHNWEYLRRGLADLDEDFEFTRPTHAMSWSADAGFSWDASGVQVECSWFGFMMLVRPGAAFTRTELGRHLDAVKIGNRNFFGGNLTKQPLFVQLRKDRGDSAYRIVSRDGKLPGADRIMNDAIFVGVYPGLTTGMLDYMIESIHAFVSARR